MIPELGREWFRGLQWSARPGARETWEPVIRRAAATSQDLELISVSTGLRRAAWVFVPLEDLATVVSASAAQGLAASATAVSRLGARVLISDPKDAGAGVLAAARGDDDALGELLGYPACCRRHFARTWAAGVEPESAYDSLEGPWVANVSLRHLGPRVLPWLPCSPSCDASVRAGERWVLAGLAAGLDMAALEAVLRLPLEWHSQGGVVEVQAPMFRYLAGGLASSHAVVRSRTGLVLIPAPPTWVDNGFSTGQAMDHAHKVLLDAAGPVESALDLGAGDGALLAALASRGGRGPWVGVECDSGRASRGAARHPGVTLLEGRIEDGPGEISIQAFDLVLIMPGRLVEMAPAQAEAVLRSTLRPARRVLAYTYGDHGSIVPLCAAAGLKLAGPVTAAGPVECVEVI